MTHTLCYTNTLFHIHTHRVAQHLASLGDPIALYVAADIAQHALHMLPTQSQQHQQQQQAGTLHLTAQRVCILATASADVPPAVLCGENTHKNNNNNNSSSSNSKSIADGGVGSINNNNKNNTIGSVGVLATLAAEGDGCALLLTALDYTWQGRLQEAAHTLALLHGGVTSVIGGSGFQVQLRCVQALCMLLQGEDAEVRLWYVYLYKQSYTIHQQNNNTGCMQGIHNSMAPPCQTPCHHCTHPHTHPPGCSMVAPPYPPVTRNHWCTWYTSTQAPLVCVGHCTTVA